MPGIPGMFSIPCMPFMSADGLAEAVLVAVFITGTSVMLQIGHFPGSLECTDGCIVHVQ